MDYASERERARVRNRRRKPLLECATTSVCRCVVSLLPRGSLRKILKPSRSPNQSVLVECSHNAYLLCIKCECLNRSARKCVCVCVWNLSSSNLIDHHLAHSPPSLTTGPLGTSSIARTLRVPLWSIRIFLRLRVQNLNFNSKSKLICSKTIWASVTRPCVTLAVWPPPTSTSVCARNSHHKSHNH